MTDIYNKTHKLLTFNRDFIKQAFYAALFVSVLMVLASLRYQSFELTLSLVIGITISFCTSLLLWKWIKHTFRDLNPDTAANSKSSPAIQSLAFALMAIGKIFVLGLVFFLIFKFLSINIYALFTGISVVQFVVFSMIASIVLVNMLNNIRGVDISQNTHRKTVPIRRHNNN